MMSIHNFLGCLKDLANNSTSILAKNVKFCLFLNLGHIKCRLKPINNSSVCRNYLLFYVFRWVFFCALYFIDSDMLKTTNSTNF